MPIYTYGIQKSDDNDIAATELLKEADRHFATNKAKALESYIHAADLIYALPEEHAWKAANLTLENPGGTLTDFELARISGAFLSMIRNNVNIENTTYPICERVVAIWDRLGFMAKPHLVTLGEGGGINLVELIPQHPFNFEDQHKNEIHEKFCKPRLMYGVFVNTLCDEDESGVEYGPVSLITAPAKTDEQLDEWLGRWCMGSIRYISSELRVLIQARLDRKGVKTEIPEFEPLQPSNEWFKNVYFWMFSKKTTSS